MKINFYEKVIKAKTLIKKGKRKKALEELKKIINGENNLSEINFINLTPHPINVKIDNDVFTYAPSGKIARVSSNLTEIDSLLYENKEIPLYKRSYGSVTDLPSPQPNTYYIVSGLVLSATNRDDVIAPATDKAERNNKGHIVSVPGFVSAK